MSFIQDKLDSKVYAPGWFLAHEECTRVTKTIPQSMATTAANGTKYVKAGTVFPSNDGNAVGIVYEDVDVTSGDMPGSVVIAGQVYEDRLPASVESAAKSAMTGIKFAADPGVVRPEYPTELTALTVTSTASASNTGKTVIAASGVSLKSGEKYAYKITDTNAAVAVAGMKPDSTWTQVADFSAEIASADGKKIAVVALTAAGEVYAYGTATVDVK